MDRFGRGLIGLHPMTLSATQRGQIYHTVQCSLKLLLCVKNTLAQKGENYLLVKFNNFQA